MCTACVRACVGAFVIVASKGEEIAGSHFLPLHCMSSSSPSWSIFLVLAILFPSAGITFSLKATEAKRSFYFNSMAMTLARREKMKELLVGSIFDKKVWDMGSV